MEQYRHHNKEYNTTIMIDDYISLEKELYQAEPVFKKREVFDIDYFVCTFVDYPKYRPFRLNEITELCFLYCQTEDFRLKLLKRGFNRCPILIYNLFHMNVFSFSEIEEKLQDFRQVFLCQYYYEYINDFEKFIYGYDLGVTNGIKDLSSYIKFGFHPKSIEYCLKYDDLEVLRDLLMNPNANNQKETVYSPFEWSNVSNPLEFLPFSAYFGSMQCFKYLMMNGHPVNKEVAFNAIACGSFDILHLCQDFSRSCYEFINAATEYCQYTIFDYICNNSVIISASENGFDLNLFLYLPFMLLRKQVI